VNRIKKIFSDNLIFVLLFIALVGVGLFFYLNVMILDYQDKIFAFSDFPNEKEVLLEDKNTVVIFGAGMEPDGGMTEHQLDRVKKGLQVYRENKQISKILVTGDSGSREDSETQAMKKFLLEQAVEENNIFVDPYGYGTYESCYRLSREFNIRRSIAISQTFHLPRIRYICGKLGTDIIGVSANLREYQNNFYGPIIRESLARVKAWLQVDIYRPSPDEMIEAKLGGY
jgi:vancomycin permeability regulator SanA